MALILLPAAGASARMAGRDKLCAPICGVPLLRRSAQRALAAGARVAVTLPPDPGGRAAALDGLELSCLTVPDAAEGMAASLRAGARWGSGQPGAALMIALPDMPDVTAADMHALLAAQAAGPDRPLRATTADGTPGHPVILPRGLWPALQAVRGDTGARALLQAHPPRHYALDGARARTDLDTPEDWAAWRALRG